MVPVTGVVLRFALLVVVDVPRAPHAVPVPYRMCAPGSVSVRTGSVSVRTGSVPRGRLCDVECLLAGGSFQVRRPGGSAALSGRPVRHMRLDLLSLACPTSRQAT